MISVDDVIEAAGGHAAVAALTGVGLPALSNWKTRGRIPAEYFFIFEKVLPAAPPLELFGFKGGNPTTTDISGTPSPDKNCLPCDESASSE